MKEVKHKVVLRVLVIAAVVLSFFVFAVVKSNALMPWKECPYELSKKDIQRCVVYIEHEQEGVALNKEKTDELIDIFKSLQYKEQKSVPDICFACACKYRIEMSFNDLKIARLYLYEYEGAYYSNLCDKDNESSSLYRVQSINEEDFNFIYEEREKAIQGGEESQEQYEAELKKFESYDAKELLVLFLERREFKEILKDAETEDIINVIHNLADTALMKSWMVRPIEEKKEAIMWASGNYEEILKDLEVCEEDKPYAYKIIEAFAQMYNINISEFENATTIMNSNQK